MKIAVLSGKGGAGKTLIAVNLAAAAGKGSYVDCDVEEPNGRLFLNPQEIQKKTVSTLLPSFDPEKCTGCRKCVDFCRFNALIYIKEKPLVFAEVCHSCGGCAMICPEKAIREEKRPVGQIEIGTHGKLRVVTGILNPGEASGVPVIKAVQKEVSENPVILDCPPGSACSVMESVSDADYCILVAEPTAFGFHNFCMVHELAVLLGKNCGVVINKMDMPYEPLEQYCIAHNLPILARIPYNEKIARLAGRGEIICEQDKKMKKMFREILGKIGGAAQ